MSTLTTYPFILIKPKYCRPRTELFIMYDYPTFNEVKHIWSDLNGEPLILDIETTGLDCVGVHQDTVVSVSFTYSKGTHCLNFKTPNGQAVWKAILKDLYDKQVPIGMYNSTFDLAFMARDLEGNKECEYTKLFNVVCDPYLLFRYCSNEGITGQQWSLKFAQVNCLLWDEKGDRYKQVAH